MEVKEKGGGEETWDAGLEKWTEK